MQTWFSLFTSLLSCPVPEVFEKKYVYLKTALVHTFAWKLEYVTNGL